MLFGVCVALGLFAVAVLSQGEDETSRMRTADGPLPALESIAPDDAAAWRTLDNRLWGRAYSFTKKDCRFAQKGSLGLAHCLMRAESRSDASSIAGVRKLESLRWNDYRGWRDLTARLWGEASDRQRKACSSFDDGTMALAHCLMHERFVQAKVAPAASPAR